jgi:hypothetical protein
VSARGLALISVRALLRQPFDDLLACMDGVARAPRPYVALAATPLAMALAWFVYTPIHELLHVLGCVATGGAVSELEIQPIYGGALLAKVFPFVVVGGEYAGRLSGFDTRGSDLVYLATDFAPYLLTVLIGVPALRLCAGRSRPLLLGAGVVVGLAPFYSVPGDYYEMGSILTTRIATWLAAGDGSLAYEGLRSDDVVALIGNVFANPAELGLGTGETAVALGLISISLGIGILLAFLTYSLGRVVAAALLGSGAMREPSEK